MRVEKLTIHAEFTRVAKRIFGAHAEVLQGYSGFYWGDSLEPIWDHHLAKIEEFADIPDVA
jgi:predicted nucleic acid-binding Zn ribbon protein